MNLVPTRSEHLNTLRSWFPDQESARQWAGPDTRYPFTDATFAEDIRWCEMPAWSLLDEENQLTGFGQYYEKAGRCHLARLVVAPSNRSKGLGRLFVRELMKIGMQDLGVNQCSLFVMSSNQKALRCYESLNFVERPYPPGQQHIGDIIFMVFERDRR